MSGKFIAVLKDYVDDYRNGMVFKKDICITTTNPIDYVTFNEKKFKYFDKPLNNMWTFMTVPKWKKWIIKEKLKGNIK